MNVGELVTEGMQSAKRIRREEGILLCSRGEEDGEWWNAARKEDSIVITAVLSYRTQNAFQQSE